MYVATVRKSRSGKCSHLRWILFTTFHEVKLKLKITRNFQQCPPSLDGGWGDIDTQQWQIYIVKFWTSLPRGPNSFNFIQFLGKFGKTVCCPPPGEILDPPVHKSCHANSKAHATAQHEIHASCNVPLTVLITCNVGHLYYLLK